jgi:isocitrate dehydrogenase kinase/phosphatase
MDEIMSRKLFDRGISQRGKILVCMLTFIAKGSCGDVRAQITIPGYSKCSIFKCSKFKRPPAKNISEEIIEIKRQKMKNKKTH